MYAVEKLSSYISRGVYTVSGPFHPFGGAVDIIVVQQQDGSYKSSPWYVRFGKFQGVLKTKEKVVTICVNGEEAKFHMYLDNKGEAYFLKEWDFDDSGDSEISSHSSGDEIDENDGNLKFKKAQSCNFDRVKNEQIVSVENEHEKIVGVENVSGKIVGVENVSGKIVTVENGNGKVVTTEKLNGKFEYTENGNGKIVNRTRSKRAMLYRLMFGGKQTNGSIKITNVDTAVEREMTPNEVENGNNECLKSELASTDNKGVDDNFNKSVTTGKDVDDLNRCLNSDSNIEELENPLKEKTENHTVNLDVAVENDDGEAKSIIHAETSVASSIWTERNGNTCCALLTESDTAIESCIEHDINNLELSSSEITCITQDSLSNLLQNGSNDASPGKVGSCESEVICHGQETTEFSKEVGGADTVDSAQRNAIETFENGVRIQMPENLDDVQFQFSHEQSNVTVAETMDSYPNFLNEDVEKTELEDRSNEECSSSILTTSVNHTTPMDIPKRRSNFEETDQLLTKSLPIIRSEIHDLDRTNDLHPLSSSLKLNSEMFGSDLSSLSINASSVTDLGNKQRVDSSPINSCAELTESKQSLEHQDMISTDKDMGKCNGTSETTVPNEVSWRLWPFGLKKSKTINAAHPVSESITQVNIVKSPMRSQSLASEDELERAKLTKKKVSLAPTSEELASLNLNEGPNSITFSFSTSMLGQQQVDARIYLWKWNTRIVISDVDGTITKSDVLGQFMPLVGKDWSQTGVAHLFSAIKENGYEFIFLSARSISQASLTRQFLMNLKQDGKALPDGPVVISPDGLFPSLYREVIRRAPHEFKISCLEEIKALFPTDCNPFYAGFGNRDTDEFSYLKVGIPKGKIFIINPKGEVVVNRRVHDSGSYASLHALVDGMFPPATVEVEEYNPWNFWKLPPPDIDI